jgi:hypothetical protein
MSHTGGLALAASFCAFTSFASGLLNFAQTSGLLQVDRSQPGCHHHIGSAAHS